MNYRPQPRSRILAFTLVELLTVITIIAILMGLLFPAINIAKDQARKAEARAAVTGIAAAVKQYYTEYGKYPTGEVGKQNPSTDVLFGDPALGGQASNQQLFDILRNTQSSGDPVDPKTYNPRAISFFEGKTSDSNPPKSGFVPPPSASSASSATPGAYIDPWGKEYFIAIDGDYDNKVTNLQYTDFLASPPLTGVCVFSVGKDGQLGTKGDKTYKNANGTNSDDIVSWQ